MDQVGPKRGSKELKMTPRWPQGNPKRIQDGPKGSQREHQGSPKETKEDKKGRRWRLQRCKKWKSGFFKIVKKTNGFYNIFEDLGVQVGAQEL